MAVQNSDLKLNYNDNVESNYARNVRRHLSAPDASSKMGDLIRDWDSDQLQHKFDKRYKRERHNRYYLKFHFPKQKKRFIKYFIFYVCHCEVHLVRRIATNIMTFCLQPSYNFF